MKKILGSVGVLAVVGALVLGATGAFFSDTETGNTFTAGAIDLKVDSLSTYNGDSYTTTTWGQNVLGVDITSERFFDFADIKPGDTGLTRVSLHVINNDAYVCAAVSNLASNDNGLTEPENAVDSTSGVGEGELDEEMLWTIWKDTNNNGIQDGEEIVLASGNPVNGMLAVYDSTSSVLAGGQTAYLGVKWELPAASGNETQTDSLTGDISFTVVQSRNNTNFQCIPQQHEISQISSVNVGEPTSESSFVMQGWSNAVWPQGGGWGGGDDQTIRTVSSDLDGHQLVIPSDPGNDSATVAMDFGGYVGPKELQIRHLDGFADDGFKVYVDGTEVGSYLDQTNDETWKTLEISGLNYTGTHTVKIVLEAAHWASYSTYGQLGISWIKIQG